MNKPAKKTSKPDNLIDNIDERLLIYIPIIHTQEDMGSLASEVKEITIKKLGEEEWTRKANLIDQLWTEIERITESLDLLCEKVRLYQDGLPICGKETEIMSDLAKRGSRNHQILLGLHEKGATLMGTESAELLLEEYHLVKRMLALRDSEDVARMEASQKGLRDALLEKRDRAISDRINRTLQPGEIGVLFLGMLHNPEEWLDPDIRVTYPLYRPPGHRAKRDAKVSEAHVKNHEAKSGSPSP